MLLYLLFAYFLGNIMTGFLVVRFIGKDDIRKQGSGNVGARNAGRILGKKGFMLTFLGDALKGALIVLIARYIGFSDEILLAGIAVAILGHIKPILLGFQGGKGISTFIGGIITLEPLLIPIIIVGFLIIYLFNKSFTFAGLGSFVSIPIALYFLNYSSTSCFITIGILIILYFAHRENIKERLSEFGTRLKDQAERFGLTFDTLEKDWGQPFSPQEILEKINTDQTTPTWIWTVHSETSTGILNDLESITAIAAERDIKVCVDCISSIGTVPIDLSRVYLASGVSGKALGAFTGLSFVFHQHHVKPSKRLPNYLDLGLYEEYDSIPFSHSSNLINALHTALHIDFNEQSNKMNQRYCLIRENLEKEGLEILAPKNHVAPIIMTVVIPGSICATVIGEIVRFHGYQLHYQSSYLRARNWIQIATIGDYPDEEIENMVRILARAIQYEQKIHETK